MLRIALRVCRDNLSESLRKLTKMESEYRDCVPMQEHWIVKDELKETKIKLEKIEIDLNSLKEEHDSLKDKFQQLEMNEQTLSEVGSSRMG
jgi:chromosome segregation ATPase